MLSKSTGNAVDFILILINFFVPLVLSLTLIDQSTWEINGKKKTSSVCIKSEQGGIENRKEERGVQGHSKRRIGKKAFFLLFV